MQYEQSGVADQMVHLKTNRDYRSKDTPSCLILFFRRGLFFSLRLQKFRRFLPICFSVLPLSLKLSIPRTFDIKRGIKRIFFDFRFACGQRHFQFSFRIKFCFLVSAATCFITFLRKANARISYAALKKGSISITLDASVIALS